MSGNDHPDGGAMSANTNACDPAFPHGERNWQQQIYLSSHTSIDSTMIEDYSTNSTSILGSYTLISACFQCMALSSHTIKICQKIGMKELNR